MATEQLANNAVTTLAGNGGSITAVATALNVANAAQFPATGNFRILIGSELMLVTAVAGLTFTVTRHIESTSAAIHNDGDAVTCILTAGGLIQAITDRAPIGIVLIEEHTGGGASYDFKARNKNGYTGTTFQADFDEYLFEIFGIVPVTNSAVPYLRVSSDGGVTWDVGNNYGWAAVEMGIGATAGGNSRNTRPAIELFTDSSSTNGISNAFPFDMHLRLARPLDATRRKNFYGFGTAVYASGPTTYTFNFSGIYIPNTAFNAAQFSFSTGNISAGTIRCYGVGK